MQERVAQLLSDLEDATHVILATGAGWSAESGLPTYKDSTFYKAKEYGGEQLTYAEVCRPIWGRGEDRERVFVPFWSGCAEMYGKATPHAGYSKIKERLNSKDYHVYTSNVDAHFLKAGFPRDRVTEIHGNITEWQCMDSTLCEIFPSETFPEKCPTCGGLPRPHIVMFADDYCKTTPYMGGMYQDWEARMEASSGVRLVIVEVGCGTVVPAIRVETEEVLRDMHQADPHCKAKLYRVNACPEECIADDPSLQEHIIPIPVPFSDVLAMF
eukprot:TRINITY_DN27897_c0_g1_i1.p1 TRINITY_DN27897_c0_g1~~TRINITY_DN27897_c0_g1_i1.p1  ORF type:complete len:288 (+),score=57.14 TRINITY_DN27897_c0_g1_i1:57-866(+)